MGLHISRRILGGGALALATILVASALILVTAYRLDRLLYSNYIQKVRSDTYFDLVGVREGFGKVIQSQSLVLRELATFIGENPNIDQDGFSRRVRGIRGIDESRISIAAAPDMVVSLIDPLEGNQGALGLDYRENEQQFPAVRQMVEAGSELITAPVNLVQGGRALILRAPVFLPNEYGLIGDHTYDEGRKFWGVVSLVLDYDQFLVKSGIEDAARKYDLVIEVANRSRNEADSLLYGERALIGEDAVMLRFDFAFEDWTLHAVTKGGWPRTSPVQWQQRIVMAVAGVLLLGILIFILQLSYARKRARLLLKKGIEALDDGFVMFDHEDRLILSNTRYKEIYDLPANVLKRGTPYAQVMNACVGKLVTSPEGTTPADWVNQRQSRKRAAEVEDVEQHLDDGRIIRVSNYPLDDGGSVGLRVDVTELTQTKLAAESASKAKTAFMGVLSHELRTPLTVIMGVATLSKNARMLRSSKALLAALQDHDLPSEKVKELLDDVFEQLATLMDKKIHSGENLLHLINELLDISTIESGNLIVEATVCDVKDIVDPIALQFGKQAEEKGLEFKIVQEAETVFADQTRVRQILINLIGNAIKFSDAGFVRLYVRKHADMVRFEVCDSGEGIPEAEFENIVERFYQIDSTDTRRAGGTGMGLAISKSLAELQGGSLTVSSTVGTGSCFVLTLPAKAKA